MSGQKTDVCELNIGDTAMMVKSSSIFCRMNLSSITGSRMILKTGNSIYYNSSEAHDYISRGNEKAKAVAVLYSR